MLEGCRQSANGDRPLEMSVFTRQGLQFWRAGDDEAEMIRWLTSGKKTFVATCDEVPLNGAKQSWFAP